MFICTSHLQSYSMAIILMKYLFQNVNFGSMKGNATIIENVNKHEAHIQAPFTLNHL